MRTLVVILALLSVGLVGGIAKADTEKTYVLTCSNKDYPSSNKEDYPFINRDPPCSVLWYEHVKPADANQPSGG